MVKTRLNSFYLSKTNWNKAF